MLTALVVGGGGGGGGGGEGGSGLAAPEGACGRRTVQGRTRRSGAGGGLPSGGEGGAPKPGARRPVAEDGAWPLLRTA